MMKKTGWFLGGLLAVVMIATFVFSGTVTKGTLGKQDIRLWYSGSSAQTFNRTSSQGYTMTLNPLDWVGIDVHQVYSVGTTRTGTIMASAASDVGYSTKRQMWLNPGTWSITADLNVGDYSDLIWHFAPGAILDIATGVTLTLPSPSNIIASPNQQIFSGAGTVSFSAGGQEIPVDWFGVNADGATSDSTAIQAAITSAVASNNDVVFYGERTFAIDTQLTVASADHTRLIGRGGYPVILWTGAAHDSTPGGADDDDSGAMIYFTGTDHAFSGIEHMSIDADEKANFCIYMGGTVNTHVEISDLHMKHAQLDLIKFKYSGTAGLVNINLDRLTGYPTASFGGSAASCGRYCINFDNVTGVGNVHVSNSNFDSGVSGVIGITQTTAYGCDYLFTNLRGEANYATSDFIAVTYGGTGTIGALTLVNCKADVTGVGSINAIVHNKSANTARPLIHMIPFETQVAITYLYEEDNDATKDVAYHAKYNKMMLTLNTTANAGILPVGTGFPTTPAPGTFYWDNTNAQLQIHNGTTSYEFSSDDSLGMKTHKIIETTYDFATHGGAVSTIALTTIPDNSTIVMGYYEVITEFTSASATNVSFGVSTDDQAGLHALVAHNHADYTAGYHNFVPDGTAANFTTKTTALRIVVISIGGDALTAGKIYLWLEYITSE